MSTNPHEEVVSSLPGDREDSSTTEIFMLSKLRGTWINAADALKCRTASASDLIELSVSRGLIKLLFRIWEKAVFAI